ncbi:MAG: transposase [Methylococcales bacterium]
MSRYRRADTPGATYFFTVVTYRRRPILCDDQVRAALRDAIKTVQSRYPFTIDAWVLLPDHLHTAWTLPPGDANYSLRWSLIKRMVSLACGQHYHRADGCRHLKPNIVKQRFGNAGIGSIKSATKPISCGMLITFITTRSNINIAHGWRNGRIQRSTDMLLKAFILKIGAPT